jgi:peptide/nickel transport system ATP-binding protein
MPHARAGAGEKARAIRGLPFAAKERWPHERVLLEVNDLKKHFRCAAACSTARRRVYAVDGVSFAIDKGETLALVGESGCGKSTVGRAILRLFDITAGRCSRRKRIDDMPRALAAAAPPHAGRVPGSDSPASIRVMRVRDLLAEPIRNFALAKSAADWSADRRLLDKVRLPREASRRWPHEFSGGQRQRIGIAARSRPSPTHRLRRGGLGARCFGQGADRQPAAGPAARAWPRASVHQPRPRHRRAHDHRVAVMYLGKIVELGRKRQIFAAPKHPYTQALLSACRCRTRRSAQSASSLQGDVPSPINPPKGCRFHTRCPTCFDRCRTEERRCGDRDRSFRRLPPTRSARGAKSAGDGGGVTAQRT